MNQPVHILLIDDNPDDRALIMAELPREMPNLRITEIFEQRGLDEVIARGGFDLVITDYQLCWSNGVEVLRSIKARHPDVPVIMFTSTGNEEVAVEAMKAGLDDYVIKSVKHFVRLRATARQVLEQARERQILRRAELRYRHFFENVPVGLFVIAPHGEIIDANPALAEILGYDNREALLAVNATDFDLDKADAAHFLRQLEEQGEIFDLEVHLGRPDGSAVWLLASARAARNDRGETLFYQGAVEDITDRKRAEEAVRESEQRFEALMDHTPVLAFIKNAQGRYEYVNQPFLRVFGKRPEDVYGRTDFDILPREMAKIIETHDREVIETGKLLETIELAPDAEDTLRSWMVVKFPITDPAEQNFVGGFAIDVTERQRAEEAEKRTQQRFRDLFESSPDAIFVEDLHGTVLDVNPAACRLHGMTAEELMGRNIIDLVPLDKRVDVVREFPRLVSGELAQFDGVSATKDGRGVPVSICANRIEYQGRPAVLLHVRDMSEQKRLQEQFLQSQKMEAIGRLAGGIAHDFNNLLTAILGYNELMMSSLAENDPLRRSGDEVRRAAERAAKLTRQLLAFSRKQTLQPRVLDINGAVAEIEKMLQRLIGDDIQLDTLPAPGKACVKADRGQIEQVVVNLAVNARDAMPNGGRLTISVSKETVTERDKTEVPPGDYVVLCIRDTGTGMTAEVRDRIFEPFFTTKEEGRGTGLGLATCYGIVKQSGGRILCESEPGAGTAFFIYLPAVDESPELPARGEPSAPLPRGTETILLVEDAASVRALASRVLRSLGYHVLEAENGERALGIIEECGSRKIDLVVTDVMMPQMGGRELVERFRARRPDTKVLFNSGSIEDKTGLHDMLLQQQNTAFLTKPFTPTDLARKVREVLDLRG